MCHRRECGIKANPVGFHVGWLNCTSPSTVPVPFLANVSESAHYPAFGPRNAYGRTAVYHNQERVNDAKKFG